MSGSRNSKQCVGSLVLSRGYYHVAEKCDKELKEFRF